MRSESELVAGRPEAAADLDRKRREVFDPLVWRAPLGENERATISVTMEAYVAALVELGEWREVRRTTVARLAEIIDYLTPGVEALADYRRDVANAVVAAEARRGEARSLMLIGAGVVFVVFAVLGVGLVVGVSGPIRSLAFAARDLAGGNRDAFIAERATPDELGDISRALRHTRNALIDAENRERVGIDRERATDQLSKDAKLALADAIEQRIAAVAGGLAAAASELSDLAVALGDMAGEASSRVGEINVASGETNANLRELAGVASTLQNAAEAISQRISHIGRNGEGGKGSERAIVVWPAIEKEVGQRLTEITNVAVRARLMALNGVIAAKRNGGEGKGLGFADIAQTTKEIANRFSADMVDFQTRISDILAPIDDIAGAVDSQGAAAREIMRNAESVVAGTLQMSNAVSRITRNAGETEKVAHEMRAKADTAARQSELLLGEITEILAQIRQ
ncbi:MAG: HAMP domain-containing protein [Alphaproteobacteria bacterium]|nr:HAMP domain-containing protein [Alphaproteobacteria bacterium]